MREVKISFKNIWRKWGKEKVNEAKQTGFTITTTLEKLHKKKPGRAQEIEHFSEKKNDKWIYNSLIEQN